MGTRGGAPAGPPASGCCKTNVRVEQYQLASLRPPEGPWPRGRSYKPTTSQGEGFLRVRIALGRDFRRPPYGGHFRFLLVGSASGALCQVLGDGTEKVREEGLSPLHRRASEARRRSPGCPAPGPGE